MDNNKQEAKKVAEESSKKGQGFNNARGEIADKKDTPKNNGQNLNNDPSHQEEREQNKKR